MVYQRLSTSPQNYWDVQTVIDMQKQPKQNTKIKAGHYFPRVHFCSSLLVMHYLFYPAKSVSSRLNEPGSYNVYLERQLNWSSQFSPEDQV